MNPLQRRFFKPSWPSEVTQKTGGAYSDFANVGKSIRDMRAWVMVGKGVSYEEGYLPLTQVRVAPSGETEALEERIKEALGRARSLEELSKKVQRIEATATRTENKVNEIYERLERLNPKQPSIWVPITSFEPEPYEVIRPITAVVSPDEEEFEAGVFDINVYSTGDTKSEAVENLKSLLLDFFDQLLEESDEQLGAELLKQKRFLKQHIIKS